MAERITWEQIDASPLLALPCEERAHLRETGDERFRAFWDTCYRAYVAKEPDTDGIAFSTTFIKVFTSYQPNPEKPGQTFSIYLRILPSTISTLFISSIDCTFATYSLSAV